jgi:hypothetical protein
MKTPTVLNMKSSKGNKVPNQFIIWTDDIQFFQSYQTIIGKRDHLGKITLDKNKWDYSVTTSKYRNQWLGMNTKQVKDAILNGSIALEDLN